MKKTFAYEGFFVWKNVVNTQGGVSMEKEWYVLHTYSGYENKVKSNLFEFKSIRGVGYSLEVHNER